MLRFPFTPNSFARLGVSEHSNLEGSTYAMAIERNHPDPALFNADLELPYQLRLRDFEIAMQDVYDFFHDVNNLLVSKGLERLDDMLRPAIMSGVLSDMLTSSLATHSRTLVVNQYFNGHPDLIVNGIYPNNSESIRTTP